MTATKSKLSSRVVSVRTRVYYNYAETHEDTTGGVLRTQRQGDECPFRQHSTVRYMLTTVRNSMTSYIEGPAKPPGGKNDAVCYAEAGDDRLDSWTKYNGT